ncbi:MAG: hemerythrin family protein [Oceanospirillales bacterium]|nr:hemerythrin family protein [Oceanospirillales bacterium]MBR9888309.1 hemerythrin family protein [Oceanospirillales bacterium]
MTSIIWKKEYDVGVREIDLQHRYFANLINRLEEELTENIDTEYQNSLIDELNAYARFHFISEENLMRKANYPDLELHRKHHQQLISNLANMELELDMNASSDNILGIIDFLVKWFLNHTTIEDQHFADYLDNN